jgi:hypothetical protein
MHWLFLVGASPLSLSADSVFFGIYASGYEDDTGGPGHDLYRGRHCADTRRFLPVLFGLAVGPRDQEVGREVFSPGPTPTLVSNL